MFPTSPTLDNKKLPLISVVIATYNYGRYLSRAINSVFAQTYPNVELIVVDDGSTDDTSAIVARYPTLIYLYHPNQGVSASRNVGLRQAKGEFLCFLDADDWLEKDGLYENLKVLILDPEAALVSGSYYLIKTETQKKYAIIVEKPEHPYCRLLESNYIGMLAAVLFRKSSLNFIEFDPSTPVCADYELFLTLARRYPILNHEKFIATYYYHPGSLSHDYSKMAISVQLVIRKQLPFLKTPEEKAAFEKGLKQWEEYRLLSDQSRKRTE